MEAAFVPKAQLTGAVADLAFCVVVIAVCLLVVVVVALTEDASGDTASEPRPAASVSPSETSAEPETFHVAGLVGYSGEMVVGRASDDAAGGMCLLLSSPGDEYAMADWTQMIVRNGSDTVVATGALSDIIYSETPERQCWRGFGVDLPSGGFYTFEVGPFTSPVYSQEELEAFPAGGISWQLNG